MEMTQYLLLFHLWTSHDTQQNWIIIDFDVAFHLIGGWQWCLMMKIVDIDILFNFFYFFPGDIDMISEYLTTFFLCLITSLFPSDSL